MLADTRLVTFAGGAAAGAARRLRADGPWVTEEESSKSVGVTMVGTRLTPTRGSARSMLAAMRVAVVAPFRCSHDRVTLF